jgi:NTE family protein
VRNNLEKKTSKNKQGKPQRALVLQGGGALGAYEVGAFEAISEKIINESNDPNENLFDIIAGTSIGALNAAIILSSMLSGKHNDLSIEQIQAKTIQELHTFWEDLKTSAVVDNNVFFSNFWKYMHLFNNTLATIEAARRYWSVVQYSFTPYGVPNLHFPVWFPDFRFLNILHPFWIGYDYSPLKDTLRRNIEKVLGRNGNGFSIKTSHDKEEPRLVIVSVDAYDCSTAVAFDSYSKNGKWFSKYGGDSNPHLVEYDGIGLNELLASCLFAFATDHTLMEDKEKSKDNHKSKRIFWDGGYLSNTPLRELIQVHKDFWSDKKEKVPDLEVYIIDLYPPIEEVSEERVGYDRIMDRINDIQFHDRTVYDEKIANIMTDYIDLVNELKKNIPEEQVEEILRKPAKSISRDGTLRTYKNLVNGRFNIEVWRIDRQDDIDTIFGKHEDFSSLTIDQLIKSGKKDATISLNIRKIFLTLRNLLLLKDDQVQNEANALAKVLSGAKLHIMLNQVDLAKHDLQDLKAGISNTFDKTKFIEEKSTLIKIIDNIHELISLSSY